MSTPQPVYASQEKTQFFRPAVWCKHKMSRKMSNDGVWSGAGTLHGYPPPTLHGQTGRAENGEQRLLYTQRKI